MNNNIDEEVILNTQEETTGSNEVETDESSDESLEDLRARLAKAEEVANNYKIRAEKAEKRGKSEEVKTQIKADSELSIKDMYALNQANVPLEDIDDVIKAAKVLNLSIPEAMKTSVVRSVLNEKAEQRNTALATNTGGAKRSSGRVSDETLLSNASRGNVPEDMNDIERLLLAKIKNRA